MPDTEARPWRRVTFRGDLDFLNGMGSDLLHQYGNLWGAAGCPDEAKLYTLDLPKENSDLRVYFFSPAAVTIANDLLKNPKYTVEAWPKPDLSLLKELDR